MLNKIPNWLKNKYVLTTVGFILWAFIFDQNNLITQYDYIKELKSLQKDKAYYINELNKTRQELKDLTTNPITLEKFAREKYYMKKDNEEIFVFESEK